MDLVRDLNRNYFINYTLSLSVQTTVAVWLSFIRKLTMIQTALDTQWKYLVFSILLPSARNTKCVQMVLKTLSDWY